MIVILKQILHFEREGIIFREDQKVKLKNKQYGKINIKKQ